ncbi:MAG: EAL domain-containing protein [Cyanobacteria bacterium RI_101]|nr:EAL domain-containing protein [Cyanobacteria bacterium RI_101]
MPAHRLERLLQGVADVTQSLLTEEDYTLAVNRALAALGEATGVDRIYVFVIHPHPVHQKPATSQLWEWVAEGIVPEIDNPLLQNLVFEEFIPRWYEVLRQGEEIAGKVRDFPESERAILQPQGILSLLAAPVMIKGKLWGFIGFDDCHREQDWSAVEIYTLKAIAGSLGGVVARHELEQKVSQRTQELLLAKEETERANQELRRENNRRKKIQKKLLHDALHDPLTGLPNRLLFMDRVERLIAHAQRFPDYQFAVLFIDLDRFKLINDSLGHHAGDRLLVFCGQLFQRLIRVCDTVARLGGDEFAILLDGVQEMSEVVSVAAQLLLELAQAAPPEINHLHLSASIGIVLGDSASSSAADLLRNADIAMYRAKGAGKARYSVFDETLHHQARRALELESDLKKVLERGELLLHYQPILHLGRQRLVGLEALLRWRHPREGLISPSEFIPIAEESGLIIPLGEWVLEESCRQLRQWQERHAISRDWSVNVNLSPRQFEDVNLSQKILAILQRYQLQPRHLKLEITESLLIVTNDKVMNILEELSQAGIQICLDDFGTGYSALSYLHQFPIDVIKIDSSFTKKMRARDKNYEIIRAIIALGQALEMAVVTEGVETHLQLQLLRSLHCELIQGFLISRPLPAPELEARIAPDAWAPVPLGVA